MPGVFEFGRMHSLLKKDITKRMLRHFIDLQVRERGLVRLERGVYAKASADPYYVASKAYGGYIGMSSALYLLDLKEEVEDVIVVCVQGSRKRMRFLNRTLLPVNLSKAAFGAQMLGDILVSKYPKVVFDMLFRPSYANFFDMFRALNRRGMTAQEWKELMYYLRGSNITTMRRAGYALEHMAPAWFTKELNKSSEANKGTSFFEKHGNEGFNRRWRIYGGFNIKKWKDAY